MADVVEAPAPVKVRPPRSRLVTVVVVVALLIPIVVVVARWLTNPTTLQPYSSVNVTGTMPIGTTFYADGQVFEAIPENDVFVPAQTPTVTVQSVQPRIVENTAGATVELLLCVRNGGTTGVGMQTDRLEESCSSLEPLRTPADIAFGFMTNQLVMRFTGVERGVLEVDGFEIEYRDGLRQGTQHVGGGTRIDFVPESEYLAQYPDSDLSD